MKIHWVYRNSKCIIRLTIYRMSNLQQVLLLRFPSQILGAGQSVVVAKDSAAMKLIFGISTLQFTGALSNSGEGITLTDAQGNVLMNLFTMIQLHGRWSPMKEVPALFYVMPMLTMLWAPIGRQPATRRVSLSMEKSCCALLVLPIQYPVALFLLFCGCNGLFFSPKDITIDVGTTVRWTNKEVPTILWQSICLSFQSCFFFGNGSPSSAFVVVWFYIHQGWRIPVSMWTCMPLQEWKEQLPLVPFLRILYSISSVTHVNQEG